MKSLLFIIVLITLINYAFCVKDKGKYLELTDIDKEAYLVAENCEKVYICGNHSKSGVLSILGFGDDILENCYYRSKLIGKINVDEGNFNNPNNCSIKKYAYIITNGCYLSSDGNYKTLINKNEYTSPEAVYYDIDIKNNRVLTVGGWCTYNYERIDANWMSYLDQDLKINEIIIPGTHDSGTYDIGKSWLLEDTINYGTIVGEVLNLSTILSTIISIGVANLGNLVNYHTAQTQDLNISDQLKNGIRYLDVRLHLSKKNGPLYLVHDMFRCYDSNYKNILYFKSVLKYCIEFLNEHEGETIIIHLKKENIDESYHNDAIAKLIQDIGKEKIYEYNDKKYKDYFFIPIDIDDQYSNDYMPTLRQAKGKIVFFSRHEFFYNDIKEYQYTLNNVINESHIPIGFLRSIKDRGDCNNDAFDKNDKICEPEIHYNFRCQDNYNLSKERKWKIVEKMLNENSIFNDKVNSTHTINFMNIAFIKSYPYSSGEMKENYQYKDYLVPIPSGSKYMNKQLTNYLRKSLTYPPNEWYVLDFPSISVIREIYNSNFDFINKPIYSPGNKKTSDIFNIVEPCEISCSLNPDDCYFNKVHDDLRRRDITYDENSTICLQRKIVIDEQGYQQDTVKLNNKCVDNNLNKWRFGQSDDDNYFSIISVYDGKCLNYSGDSLYMQKCKDNNIHQDFTIENDIVCSRFDTSKCFNGFEIYPTSIKPKEYENLTCSITFARLGIQCCSNQNAKVERVDNVGNWAIENGKWCGIGYTRCSFEVLGYHCCSSVNPNVVKEDSYGKWGEEDGELCGIGEMNRVISYRIRNIKTKQCVLVNNSDGNLIDLGECTTSNHSLWHISNIDEYSNKKITSVKNEKCLYAANAQTPGLENCETVMNIKDRYMHFEIIEDKYLCVKNSKNLKYNCLSSKSLNFEGSYNKNDESFQWEIQDINEGVIVLNENDIYNPNRNNDPPKISPPSDSVDSDCPIDNYPCCSSGNTEIVYTDEEGNWGSENNEWCLIVDNSQDIINNTESECPYDGYPCCSSNNSKFYFSDESGIWGYKNTNWGYENGYCIINDDISKYTKVTSYDLCIFDFYGYPCCSSNVTEISMTDDSGTRWGEENGNYCGYYESKSDYKSYWFYHAESNKCLYAPENIFISDKVTLKTCDESDYSKWMTLESRTGFIYSVAYPNYCININSNDEITLGLCNNYAKISHTDSALFIPTLFEDKCIGLLNDDDINKDSISLRLNTCTNKLSDNFYVWNETDYKQNIMNLGKYNYCSSNISEIVFTDDVGNWGVENGEWCLIKDN